MPSVFASERTIAPNLMVVESCSSASTLKPSHQQTHNRHRRRAYHTESYTHKCYNCLLLNRLVLPESAWCRCNNFRLSIKHSIAWIHSMSILLTMPSNGNKNQENPRIWKFILQYTDKSDGIGWTQPTSYSVDTILVLFNKAQWSRGFTTKPGM